jgi:hypothetical protein
MRGNKDFEMNERIKQLAEQAGYTTDMFGIGHWDMPECKKFTELIVAECCKEITYASVSNEDPVFAYAYIDHLKNTLGVKNVKG